MKKLVLVPMIAVAALGLSACKWGSTAPGNTSEITNETIQNTEELNTTAPEDATLNDTVVDNATAIDNASNATAK
jgi:hypothetical protein